MGYEIKKAGVVLFETDNPIAASRLLFRSLMRIEGASIECKTAYLKELLRCTVKSNKGIILSAAMREGFKEISGEQASQIVSSAIAA